TKDIVAAALRGMFTAPGFVAGGSGDEITFTNIGGEGITFDVTQAVPGAASGLAASAAGDTVISVLSASTFSNIAAAGRNWELTLSAGPVTRVEPFDTSLDKTGLNLAAWINANAAGYRAAYNAATDELTIARPGVTGFTAT